MLESGAFDTVAERLEHISVLDRLEARGTLRLAMKEAGFEPRSIESDELCVVIQRILPGELTARGVESAASVCQELVCVTESLGDVGSASADSSPEGVFRRLGGD
jgi:hypothetical protein